LETNEKNINHKLKSVLQFMVEVFLVSGLVYYFYENSEQFDAIMNIRLWDIVRLVGLNVIVLLLFSAQLKQMIRILGKNISFSQSVWLTAGCTLLNYLPMNIGMIVKARGLKIFARLKYSYFASLSITDLILTVFAGSVIGIIILISSWDITITRIWYLASAIMVVLIATSLLLVIPLSFINKDRGKIRHIIWDFLSGIDLIKRNPMGLTILFSFISLRLLLIGIQFWICFSSIGVGISFWNSVLFAVITALIMIFNITPGGLGFREVLIGAISAGANMGFEVGVLAAGLYRVSSMIVHIIMGGYGLIVLRTRNIFKARM